MARKKVVELTTEQKFENACKEWTKYELAHRSDYIQYDEGTLIIWEPFIRFIMKQMSAIVINDTMRLFDHYVNDQKISILSKKIGLPDQGDPRWDGHRILYVHFWF